MAISVGQTLFILCFIAHNTALLFHGDLIPGQATTTLGPLGKDATLSLLVQEVLELKARVKSQEQEMQTMKIQQASAVNATANTVNKVMSEYINIKTSFGIIKQEFDQNNNQTGLLSLKARLDNMAKSIQNLTISQQDHEIHDEATNMTVYREFEKMNTKLYELLGSTNKTFMKLLENMHSEITTITATESSDIQRLESQVSAHTSATSSNIGTIQTELHNLEDTLFRKLKPIDIRLSGGGSSGRVEVSILGTWGTVCDDSFGDEEAKVVCRMLGRSTTNARAYGRAHFGHGGGPILLDDLSCTGYESNLLDCNHRYIGHNDCSHNEDAGVSCG